MFHIYNIGIGGMRIPTAIKVGNIYYKFDMKVSGKDTSLIILKDAKGQIL